MRSNHKCLHVLLTRANLYVCIHFVRLVRFNSLMLGPNQENTFLADE